MDLGNVPPMQTTRARWPTRWTFIIASVGSAVGLGNVWRFPFLSYKHGGGAFLIPYVIFLFVTGIPLMQTELALGRLFQRGDIEAFGAIHKRARGVGCISVIGGFAVMTYYSVIVAWALYYFGASFTWPFPWAQRCGAADEACMADPLRALPLARSQEYFTNSVMQFDASKLESGAATGIAGPIFGCLLVTWVVCFLATFRSVRSIGAATRITVTAPWVLMAVFIIYNATLDGSGDGIRAYIGEWDLSVLQNGDAWSDAAGQIFFTLSVTLGVMSAYASFAPATTNIWADNNYICYINCITSFFAGFAVFSILGNMAHRQRTIAGDTPALRVALCESNEQNLSDLNLDGCPECSLCGLSGWQNLQYSACCGDFSTDNVAQDSFVLVFSVYPAALQYLGRGGANILACMWFAMLFLLGIDTLFAHIEGSATVLTDTPRFRHLRKDVVAALVCSLGFLVSLAFASDIGHALIETFDHYVISYGMFFTGALEAYTVSWVWGWQDISRKCGYLSALFLTGGYTLAAFAGVAFMAVHNVAEGLNFVLGVAAALLIFGLGALLSFVARENVDQTVGEWFGVWALAGTRNLRRTFQVDPKPRDVVLHIVTFDIPIKYLSPMVLLGLFVNQIIFDATKYDNGFQNHPDWLHGVVGGLVLGVLVFSLLIFAIYPDFWDVMGVDKDQGAQVAYYAGEAKDTEGVATTSTKPMFDHARLDGWGSYVAGMTSVITRRPRPTST